MTSYLMLLVPAANHVYGHRLSQLAAAELALTTNFSAISQTLIAGNSAISFQADELGVPELESLARQSAAMAIFSYEDGLLRPIDLPKLDVFDADLVTIPKYQGKTNPQFTKLLLHIALAQAKTKAARDAKPLAILDPLAGRGTTLLTAWRAGHNGYGVEAQLKSLESLEAYLKTYLRRARIKYSANITTVRREGKTIGKRFDANARDLEMTVFTGDTRDSAKLFGKRSFDAIITDAPYGVVHGASRRENTRSQQVDRHSAKAKDRSAQILLTEAIPIWASQLRQGGVLGLAWNTLNLSRTKLAGIVSQAGLNPCEGDNWRQFEHRVDSSINRDIMVAVKPA